jgi:hypothetical protein
MTKYWSPYQSTSVPVLFTVTYSLGTELFVTAKREEGPLSWIQNCEN